MLCWEYQDISYQKHVAIPNKIEEKYNHVYIEKYYMYTVATESVLITQLLN